MPTRLGSSRMPVLGSLLKMLRVQVELFSVVALIIVWGTDAIFVRYRLDKTSKMSIYQKLSFSLREHSSTVT